MKMQEMMERLLATQAKAEANREQMLAEIRANRKAYREDLKSDQAKMIVAFKGKMDTWIANIKDARKKSTACQEVTGANPEKIEPNSGEEEIAVEQQEIPNEEVTVH
jgi:predicted PP-loop superfamily ATPase